jgi:peroxiredoxin
MNQTSSASKMPAKPLSVGTPAPDFTLHSTPDQTASLSEFRGQPVVLVFYPADWSPVCGDEIALFNELYPEFQRYDAVLLGISVDGPWCHIAFAHDRKLRFPLLSDFEAKGEVARKYGVYRLPEGVCERALFVIDAEGTIRWNHVSPIGINPGVDGVLNALEEISAQKRGCSTPQEEKKEVEAVK